MHVAVGRLKERRDFLVVAGAHRKWAAPGLVLQARRRPAAEDEDEPHPRVGFTASRKVGSAVVRNRSRRRLKAAAERVIPGHAAADHDYVVIARAATAGRPFDALVADLETALRKLGAYRELETGRAAKESERPSP